MTDRHLIDILRLINTGGIGPVTFYEYLKKFSNCEELLSYLVGKKDVPSIAWAEDEIDKAEKIGAKILTFDNVQYPEALKQLNDAPPILYIKGHAELLKHPISVAVVGARNASIAGRKIASKIAYDLTNQDVLVISGMARGIDAAAHKGALYAQNQSGPTVAVLGTGIGEIYPRENEVLYHNIEQQGLLISEFALETKAQVSNFPRRNRIISALSQGTLIVEAGLNSGSLITARLALEQGKEIFAVPGSPLDSRSVGPNSLIKDGAVLTESADDIIKELQLTQGKKIKNLEFNLLALDKVKNNVNISADKKVTNVNISPEPKNLLDFIDYTGVDIDELLTISGLSQADFFTQLLELEMSGKIERQVGNKVTKIK